MDCIICGNWFSSTIHDGACPTCSRAIKQLGLSMTPGRLLDLAKAEKDGRLVVLPNVQEHDRKSFVDGLQDYFQEASFCDRSVGIFGMSEGEKELASALMNALTSEEAEAALKKREEADNETV